MNHNHIRYLPLLACALALAFCAGFSLYTGNRIAASGFGLALSWCLIHITHVRHHSNAFAQWKRQLDENNDEWRQVVVDNLQAREMLERHLVHVIKQNGQLEMALARSAASPARHPMQYVADVGPDGRLTYHYPKD